MLLAILALGLIAMHHTPAQGEGRHDGSVVVMAASIAAEPMSSGHDMHAMLHECLAVLGQFAMGALLVLLAVAGIAWRLDRHRATGPRAVARAPDRPGSPGGRSLLTSVCVLRL